MCGTQCAVRILFPAMLCKVDEFSTARFDRSSKNPSDVRQVRCTCLESVCQGAVRRFVPKARLFFTSAILLALLRLLATLDIMVQKQWCMCMEDTVVAQSGSLGKAGLPMLRSQQRYRKGSAKQLRLRFHLIAGVLHHQDWEVPCSGLGAWVNHGESLEVSSLPLEHLQ